MTKYVRVEVTADDIAKGIPGSNYCPVALALDRALPLPLRWRVTPPYKDDRCRAWVWWEDEQPTSLLGPLPRSVTRFVTRFDDGRPVEPFAFRVLR